jgi:uncharacterized protein YcfJ
MEMVLGHGASVASVGNSNAMGGRSGWRRLGFSAIRKSGVIAAVTVLMLATGCTGYNGYSGYGPNQVGGTLVGAAAGGLLGSTIGSGSGRLAATAAGALIGAGIGGSVGQSMDRSQYYRSGQIPSYTPGGYIYRGDPYNSAYWVGQGPQVPQVVQNNVFSVPAVQYQYPAYREVVWAPVSDTTVYRQGTAPVTSNGCMRVYDPNGRILSYCPDRFGGWSLRP